MKTNKTFLLLLASSLVMGIAGCTPNQNNGGSSIAPKTMYDIKFVNYDETVLQESQVEEGQMPAYTGQTPEKPGTNQYHYVYTGWDKEIVAAVANATYTAVYREEINTYSVTFMSNGQQYKKETVSYGEKVTKPDDPVRSRTAQEIFIFEGWELDNQAFDFDTLITADITLTAKWDSVSATEHSDRCTHIHYAAKEPTYAKPGNTDFWFCELHRNLSIEEPLVGHVEEAQEDFPYAITSDMPMYIAPLEGGNVFMSLKVGKSINGKAIVRTEEMLDTMLSVSFRYRVKNATEPKWFGVAVSTNKEPSCYNTYWEGEGDDKQELPLPDVYVWKTMQPEVDGAWHSVAFDLDEQSGYLVFVHASHEFEEDAVIEIDNVFIEVGAGEYFEDFTNPSLFKFLNNNGDVDGEKKQNDFLRLVHMNTAPELALVISKKSYTNITKISFKYRVSTEEWKDNIQPWIMVIITPNGDDPDVYGTGSVANKFLSEPQNDGEWHKISFTMSGTGHVVFGNECGHWGMNQNLDYDDIEIEYGDNKKATDHFDSFLLFKTTTNPTHAAMFTIASEDEIIDEDAYIPGQNYMARLHVGTLVWKEEGLLYSTDSYENVTNVSFKIRITGSPKAGKESSTWMGINVNGTCSNWEQITNYPRPSDGEWHEVSVNIGNKAGHIVFAYNMYDYEEGTVMDFDDIVITANGQTYEENFDNETYIFTLDEQYAQIKRNKA